MSQTPALTPENISALISQLLETKDPAAVGLRKILKRKAEECEDFPLREHSFEQFDEARTGGTFTDAEKRVFSLEKKCADLHCLMKDQKKRAEKAVQAAYEKGLAQGAVRGRKEGEAAAGAQYDKKLEKVEVRFAELFESIEAQKRRMLSGYHQELLSLAFALARRVIHADIRANPDLVLATIKKALSYVAERDRLVVRIAPDELAKVTEKHDFWAALSDRLETIRIEEDNRVDPGGCIIESPSGIVDGRIGVQLEELEEELARTWNEFKNASEDTTE
jgi:flagellar assembly protein FliH